MYLTCVKLKNFRGYGENNEEADKCFVYDNLDASLVIFKGYNGFGKTSFYEAIEWCLTDNVYRLEKFYEDKTYQVNELKKSHYLKFYHPINGNLEKRKIYVELIFNTGLSIVRKSESNVLRTTAKDTSYKSIALMGYDTLKEVTNEDVIRMFISETKDKEAFFHTHMLGQESISDFLRHNSPSKRREIFMQLLQEEELNSLFQKVQKTQNGNILTKKYNSLKSKVSKYRSDQLEIENFIKKLEIPNISSYIDIVQNLYMQINQYITDNITGEDLNLDNLLFKEELDLNICVSLLRNISFTVPKLSSLRESYISKTENLNRIKNRLITLGILEQAKNKVKKANHATKILENNLDEVNKQLQQSAQAVIHYDHQKNEIEKKIKALSLHKNIFSSLKEYINLSQLSIDEDFWNALNEEQVKWKSFISIFENDLKDNQIRIEIQDLSIRWFKDIQDKYTELQSTKKVKNDELDSLRVLKGRVSSLNKQYQESLTSVKKLIINNHQDIINCPVCLNEDFSDDKYSNETINGWDSSLSISDKILAIIDTTFASGNEEIDALSKRESEILEQIKNLEKNIEKEVLNKLIERLNKILKSFNIQFNDLEKHFNQNIDKITGEIQNQKDHQKNLLQIIERINESLLVLFGTEFELKDLNLNELEKIVNEKEKWFKENASKLEFLNSYPNLTEIESEILLIKDSQLDEVKQEEITQEISILEKKLQYLSDLASVFTELLKYKLPVEYESTLKEFDRIEDEIEKLNDQMDVLQNYKEKLDSFHGQLLGKQRKIVKERLENHPIISWVYETINPHPFHKKLYITNTERGTNFIGQTQLDDKVELYLDQMFSAAQLNILALSIFFGLALTQRYSKLHQLFLDDPIQSMDDVNILAFIDVLRAIMDSKFGDTRIIISTHNEDFAQLLAIKMRNRNMVQYSIEGYTEEGPKIRKR